MYQLQVYHISTIFLNSQLLDSYNVFKENITHLNLLKQQVPNIKTNTNSILLQVLSLSIFQLKRTSILTLVFIILPGNINNQVDQDTERFNIMFHHPSYKASNYISFSPSEIAYMRYCLVSLSYNIPFVFHHFILFYIKK